MNTATQYVRTFPFYYLPSTVGRSQCISAFYVQIVQLQLAIYIIYSQRHDILSVVINFARDIRDRRV